MLYYNTLRTLSSVRINKKCLSSSILNNWMYGRLPLLAKQVRLDKKPSFISYSYVRNPIVNKNIWSINLNVLNPIPSNSSLNGQRHFTTSKIFFFKSQRKEGTDNKKGVISTLYYIAALGVLTLGLSYAAVPLYRIFCQAYSYGGTTQAGHDADKVESMETRPERVLTIRFNADTAASMQWNFKPQQHEIKLMPGETALAFYTACNPTDRPVIGISTYNVIPFDAGQYFNKIQCFCFEEQMLNPHEEVHMPVFFYIDPEFVDDPKMENVNMLTLSYTFFESKEGLQLPLPSFASS